jgi:hypothetical protein
MSITSNVLPVVSDAIFFSYETKYQLNSKTQFWSFIPGDLKFKFPRRAKTMLTFRINSDFVKANFQDLSQVIRSPDSASVKVIGTEVYTKSIGMGFPDFK